MDKWTVYLVECSDSTFYCGTCKTSRLQERIKEHNLGVGSKYTRSRKPVILLVKTKPLKKQKAYQVEYTTKRLPKSRKIDYLKTLSE
jgi:putative endonuclease